MLKKVLVLLLLLSLGISLSSAATMDVSPNSIEPGDTVQISYSGLSNGSSFSLLIKGKIDVSPGSGYRMDIKSFVIPISLSNGTISAKADNSKQLSLNYEDSAGTIKSITKIGNSGDVCSITQDQGISAKTYDNMWIEGIASAGNLVNTELSFIGEKSGPDSGTISFVLDGIDHATMNIVCRVDSSSVANELIYVGGGSVNTSTATTTASATSPSSSGVSGGSVGGGASSSGSVVSGNTVIDTSQPGSEILTEDSGSSGAGESLTSVDGSFTYSGTGASGSIIMYDSIKSVPSGWNPEGQAYALISDGNGLNGKISFKIPESFISSDEMDSLFIAEYRDGQWLMVQSEINNGIIESSVSNEGTFALMSLKDKVTGEAVPEQTEKKSAGIPFLISFCIIVFALAISLKLKK